MCANSDSTASDSVLPVSTLAIAWGPSSNVWRARMFVEVIDAQPGKVAEDGVDGLLQDVLNSACRGPGPYFFRWSLSCWGV